MHYYQFNIADYRKDTTHLSMLEHGAYRQLLDWHYLDQAPIPKETEVVFRRLSARTEDEQKAILIVLKELFVLTDDGYIQHRVMREIDDYIAKADRARDNGKLGGRPPKTKVVISDNPEQTQAKANPLTNELINSLNNTHTVEVSTIASVCISIKQEFDLQNKQCTGISQTNPLLIALIDAGASPQEFADAAKTAANKGKGFSYVLGVVKRQREDAANLTLHKGAMPSTKSTYEQGIQIAASSIFTPENTAHLNKFTTLEADYEQRAIAG